MNNNDKPSGDSRDGFGNFYATSGIIRSKLQPPYIKVPPFDRTGMVEQYADFLATGGLISIVAPAGSGKTTLMTELLKTLTHNGEKFIWLNLDKEDDELSVFAKYLIASLHAIDADFAEKELSITHANPSRDYAALLNNIAVQLCSLNTPLYIFVDDFHYISCPVILGFWRKLVFHAPKTMGIIIASRQGLSIDLSRKRMADAVAEITQSDLNLSSQEIRHYIEQRNAITLKNEDAQSLFNTTDGWFAGVQLVAMAIAKSTGSPSDIIKSFSGRDKELADYLLHAVLNSQAPDVQEFLLKTSPLNRMNSELCDFVLKQTTSESILHGLDQSNHFIVAEDQRRAWFRYHHLFGDFLSNELNRRDPGAHAAICSRAAIWWKKRGNLTEAIQYILLAGEYKKATSLIAKHAPSVAQNLGDHFTILDWFRRLPGEYHSQKPELLLTHAWSRAFSRDTNIAKQLCEQVLLELDKDTDNQWELQPAEKTDLIALAKTIVVVAATCADDLSTGLNQGEKLFGEISSDQHFIYSTLYNNQSYASYGLRDVEASLKYATEAYKYGKVAGSIYAQVWGDFLTTLSLVEQGRLQSAREISERALENTRAESAESSYLHSMAALINSEVCIQQGDFKGLEGPSQFNKMFASVFGPLEPLLLSVRNEARWEAWRGNLGTAIKVLRQGQDTALGTNQLRLFYALVAEEIHLQLRWDTLDAAEETLRRSNFFDINEKNFPADAIPIIREIVQISSIRMNIAAGEPALALKQLNTHLYSLKSKNPSRVCTYNSLSSLKSVALWTLGRKKESIRELDKCLSRCAVENHAYPIISAADMIAEILYEIEPSLTQLDDTLSLAKRQFHKNLTNIIEGKDIDLSEKDKPAQPASPSTEKVREDLTNRELEILRLLGSGLSNQELAQQIHVSESTVKWHLHNIYGKINVKTRAAAAAKAHQMNLV